VKLYTRQELKMLKWKFINKDKMSPRDAEKRVANLLKWSNSQYEKKKQKLRDSPEKQEKAKFKEGIRQIRGI